MFDPEGSSAPRSRAGAGGSATPLIIYDTTLRDGEQMPGVAFSREQKVRLARALAETGLRWLEAGFPCVCQAERDSIRAVVEALERDHPGVRVLVLARCRPQEVEAALEVGAHGVLLFSPASDLHLRVKGLKVAELAAAISETVGLARDRGLWTSYSAEDATRAPPERLRELFAAAAGAGAQRLGLTDTVGVATPVSMMRLVGLVRGWFPHLPLSVHCHNDLGLATANSLAAVEAGAGWVATTVGGIGERGGNTPLEEFVMARELSTGLSSGLDTSRLKSLADMVSRMAGLHFQPHKPVVGDNAFTHESGLHAAAVAVEPASYEPYDPARVGQHRRVVLGKHTGRRALVRYLLDHGLPRPDPQTLEGLLSQVKQAAQEGRRTTPRELARHLMAQGVPDQTEGDLAPGERGSTQRAGAARRTREAGP